VKTDFKGSSFKERNKMSIRFCEQNKTFYLTGKKCSYFFRVNEEGYLEHLYYGKSLSEENLSYLFQGMHSSFSPCYMEWKTISLNVVPQEFPIYGRGDYRVPSVLAKLQNGSRITDFRYKAHTILKDKPAISNMPTLRGGETLVVTLEDKLNALEVDLYYTIYDELSVVARRSVIRNCGENAVSLLKLNSFNLDINRAEFDCVTLHGAPTREREIDRTPLSRNICEVSSTRGASSHHSNPFMAVCDKNADEYQGEVYGFNLIYSGSHSIKAQVTEIGFTRVSGGINEQDFAWLLGAGESFETPEAVLAYSDGGFNQLSQQFHDLYREYLIHPNFAYKKRPVLLNNWESTYFDFDEKKLCDLIEKAKGTGIDTFVLDDGWFGKRNDDWSSLGDWFVNKDKLPGGLTAVIEKCRECNMKFGLWFEPEMINENSDLFRAHPNWHIAAPDIKACKSRHQWMLDFANPEVVEYIKKTIGDILSTNDISYVKWDANRTMTEFYSPYLPIERQQETAHRYMLGVYELAKYLTESFPNVFFEGCAGGGGRFDPGMLYYFPQIWTSDNSDGGCRAFIQYGTSMCYPLSAMSGHISICPNHQIGRVTPIQTRMDMASFCATGYELNLHALTEEDFAKISNHISFYNGIHDLILKGDLYRLLSPFDGNYFSQMVVSKDKKRAVFIIMKILAKGNDNYVFVKLKGLDKDKYYSIADMGTFKGDVLMNVGLGFPKNMKDFETKCFTIEAVE
jgi:alpha-galactosidase